MSYDKTISADLYDQKWEDGTITITMKRGASVPVIVIKVTGAELTGSYTLSVKADAGAAEWSAAKTGELSGDSVVAYFTKPGAEPFFVDVVSGAWYESTVRYAAEAGLMAGTGDDDFPRGDYHPDDRDHPPPYGDGRFGPGDTITREQMAAILYRYAQGRDVPARADLSAYADAEKISPLCRGPMPAASSAGPVPLPKPGGGATRAQAAAILVRFCTGAGGLTTTTQARTTGPGPRTARPGAVFQYESSRAFLSANCCAGWGGRLPGVPAHQETEDRLLGVEAVLRLLEDLVGVGLKDLGGDLLAPVGGQAVLHHAAGWVSFISSALTW